MTLQWLRHFCWTAVFLEADALKVSSDVENRSTSEDMAGYEYC